MIDPVSLLAEVPEPLRKTLIDEYIGLCRAFTESRWKLTELDAGRFCEAAHCIVSGKLSGSYPSSPTKPANFVAACRALENAPPTPVGDRSLRILIPRLLPAIYEVRNNRGVGHVGGDVNANSMDALLVRQSCAWILAELVRIFHSTTTEIAQRAVEAISQRIHPLVWEVDGIRRVLAPAMKAQDRALALLYSVNDWINIKTLNDWVIYPSKFKQSVLKPLFTKRLIEMNQDRVVITPRGIQHVEDILMKSVAAA